MPDLKLTRLEKALASLEEGYKPSPSELERDGIIQRFEFSLELCWKTSQKVLSANGISTDVPKNTFRELAKLKWIESPEPWFSYIDARNKASHIYNREMAKEVFALIDDFLKDAKVLLGVLETKVK